MGIFSWLKGSANDGENPYRSPNLEDDDEEDSDTTSETPVDHAAEVRRKFKNLHSRESSELMTGAIFDWGMRTTRCHVAETVSDSEIMSAVIDLLDPRQREYIASLKRHGIVDKSVESNRQHIDLAWLDKKQYDLSSPSMLMLHADLCAITGEMDRAKILYKQALGIARENGFALSE